MSASQFDEFERRMRRINRRHSKLSQGYVTAINSDGLVVAKPQRRAARGPRPWVVAVRAIAVRRRRAAVAERSPTRDGR